MRIEISPEPSEQERAAIEQALLGPSRSSSPWWRQGVRENALEDGTPGEPGGSDEVGPAQPHEMRPLHPRPGVGAGLAPPGSDNG